MPLAFCIAGLFTGHGPMLLSGLGQIQNDLGDSRFNNYLLEHSYLWLLRRPLHLSFWDPPFFYPAHNVAAYSDSMLGSAPLYWVWRGMGFEADTSFQLWALLLSTLNFGAAFWLLRRKAHLSPLASSSGAFLFAFAASRINQTMHHQLLPHFFSVIAVGALWTVFEGGPARRARGAIWVFAGACVLQIYAGVYLGWFLGLGLFIAGAWALSERDSRKVVVAALRQFAATWLAAAVTAAAALGWLGWHYAKAAQEVGGAAAWSEVDSMLPRAASWLHLGPYSWMYAWTTQLPVFQGFTMEHEQRLGVGWGTTAMVLFGLGWALWRRDRRGSLMALVLLSAAALSSRYAFEVSPWKAVYLFFPGAQAIRAQCRIAVALLLPASLGLGLCLDWVAARKGRLAALALGAWSVLEQGETTPTYDKNKNRAAIADLAQRVHPESCDAFLASPVLGQDLYWKYALDAMWAQLESGIPTVNGYSRTHPPGWDFDEVNITYEGDEESVARRLAQWEAASGLRPERTCWIKRKVRDGPNQAEYARMTVPARMSAGADVEVEVVMKNSGDTTWSKLGQYRLGVQAPQDTKNWSTQRAELPNDIPAGQEAVFHFHITAPKEPGRYAFRWRMVQETVLWFGEYTALKWVDVDAAQ